MKSSVSMSAFILALLVSSLTVAQTSSIPIPLSNNEALAFIKGKDLTGDLVVAQGRGQVHLQFKENGTMYGNNQGSSDSGKWRVEDGKLCMSWRRWDYDGCGKLVRSGDAVQHLNVDGNTVHLVFRK